ncbi:unnamed protein product, partial [marine sediment metagenome]
MNNQVVKRIENLDDAKVVKLFNFIGEQILEGIKVDDLSEKISPEMQSDHELSTIM